MRIIEKSPWEQINFKKNFYTYFQIKIKNIFLKKSLSIATVIVYGTSDLF